MHAEENRIGYMTEQHRRAAEEMAREFASWTEQREHLNEVARQNAQRQREIREAAQREEAHRLAVQAANNPLLPQPRELRLRRHIAWVGSVNEPDDSIEERIDVDADTDPWPLEDGELVRVMTDFGELPQDYALRMAALAMELTARQLEDDNVVHLTQRE